MGRKMYQKNEKWKPLIQENKFIKMHENTFRILKNQEDDRNCLH